jgi:hypothetical protein
MKRPNISTRNISPGPEFQLCLAYLFSTIYISTREVKIPITISQLQEIDKSFHKLGEFP